MAFRLNLRLSGRREYVRSGCSRGLVASIIRFSPGACRDLWHDDSRQANSAGAVVGILPLEAVPKRTYLA